MAAKPTARSGLPGGAIRTCRQALTGKAPIKGRKGRRMKTSTLRNAIPIALFAVATLPTTSPSMT
jgi:hypothetical protein